MQKLSHAKVLREVPEPGSVTIPIEVTWVGSEPGSEPVSEPGAAPAAAPILCHGAKATYVNPLAKAFLWVLQLYS